MKKVKKESEKQWFNGVAVTQYMIKGFYFIRKLQVTNWMTICFNSYEIDLNGENNSQIQVLVCTRMNSSSLFSRKSRVLGIAKIDISELEVSKKITKWFDLEQING